MPTTDTTLETTLATGKRLVELMNTGEANQAIEELYTDDCEHHEATEAGEFGGITEGKQNILKAAKAWQDAHDIHSGHTDGPYPHTDRFICFMTTELTAKDGPMAGQRMTLKEACLYHVTPEGKINKAEFFYDAQA